MSETHPAWQQATGMDSRTDSMSYVGMLTNLTNGILEPMAARCQVAKCCSSTLSNLHISIGLQQVHKVLDASCTVTTTLTLCHQSA